MSRWISVKDYLPDSAFKAKLKDDKKVLVFSPNYPEGDPMRFRIDYGWTVKLGDATHWQPLVPPVEDQD